MEGDSEPPIILTDMYIPYEWVINMEWSYCWFLFHHVDPVSSSRKEAFLWSNYDIWKKMKLFELNIF